MRLERRNRYCDLGAKAAPVSVTERTERMALTIGIQSPGDMGHAVGRVLQQNGAEVVAALDGRSERTRGLCEAAGIRDIDNVDALVSRCDLILSILVPAQAEAAAETVAAALKRTGTDMTYVDCNAISPGTVKRIDDVITSAGSRFVDAGIIGGPPRDKDAGTRFPASGPDAARFAELVNYGLKVRVVGEAVGQASRLKMCYAALTKGTSALLIQLLTAAHRMGLYEALVEEFENSQGERLKQAERSVPGVPAKAHRWVGEMEEIAKTFAEAGLTPKTYEGAASIFAMVAASSLGSERPETRDPDRTLEETIRVFAESEANTGKAG